MKRIISLGLLSAAFATSCSSDSDSKKTPKAEEVVEVENETIENTEEETDVEETNENENEVEETDENEDQDTEETTESLTDEEVKEKVSELETLIDKLKVEIPQTSLQIMKIKESGDEEALKEAVAKKVDLEKQLKQAQYDREILLINQVLKSKTLAEYKEELEVQKEELEVAQKDASTKSSEVSHKQRAVEKEILAKEEAHKELLSTEDNLVTEKEEAQKIVSEIEVKVNEAQDALKLNEEKLSEASKWVEVCTAIHEDLKQNDPSQVSITSVEVNGEEVQIDDSVKEKCGAVIGTGTPMKLRVGLTLSQLIAEKETHFLANKAAVSNLEAVTLESTEATELLKEVEEKLSTVKAEIEELIKTFGDDSELKAQYDALGAEWIKHSTEWIRVTNALAAVKLTLETVEQLQEEQEQD